MTLNSKWNQPTVTDWLIGFIWGGMDCVVRTIVFWIIGFICCVRYQTKKNQDEF